MSSSALHYRIIQYLSHILLRIVLRSISGLNVRHGVYGFHLMTARETDTRDIHCTAEIYRAYTKEWCGFKSE